MYTRRLYDIPITNATLALISDLPRLFEELYSKAAIKLKHKFQVAEFADQAKIRSVRAQRGAVTALER